MKIKSLLIPMIICTTFSYAAPQETQSLYFKEKQELLEVKDELNEFYETKELEYQKNKAELEKIHKEIQKSEEAIKKIKAENEKILKEIQREITTKAINMFDKMKTGVAVNIFTEMTNNGKIDEVFDIIVRMKEGNVIKIMKKLDTKTSALLMEKMKILKNDKQNKE